MELANEEEVTLALVRAYLQSSQNWRREGREMALVYSGSELQEDTFHTVYRNEQACFLWSEIVKAKGSVGRRQAARADNTICMTRKRKGVFCI